ncbi:MAG: type II toxin-antitoxin system prevent-host-death family antitoxin [Oscillospiraceae bacterium]|nr:type II toxin-antitoxin system prevent-host-death family antitoxin [Oscillospiraceae bacterium]
MITATAADVQNDFIKYFEMAQNGEEITITFNGKAAKLIGAERLPLDTMKAMRGILKGNYDEDEMHAERIEKRESMDRYKCDN